MKLPPTVSSLALKEWAIAVNALAKGEQIMILRKGGIHRDDKEFRMVHPEFLLYPTFEHQKAELLKEEFHGELASTLAEDNGPGLFTVSCWAEVSDIFELRDQETLQMLSPHHIWTSSYAAKRLHWRPKHPLTVALLRVYTLEQPQALPVLDQYEGCKSWVNLGQDVFLGNMSPVLADDEYARKADAIRQTLEVGVPR